MAKIDPNLPEQFVKDEDVAKLLGLSPITIKIWRMKGEGPPYRRFSRSCIRYLLSEVVEWAKGRTQVSTAQNTKGRAS